MKHFYTKIILLALTTFVCSNRTHAQTYATIPYSTGFESGIDNSWIMTSSLTTGEIDTFLTGALTWASQTALSHSGNYFLGMHNTGSAFNLNEAELHLDCSGGSYYRLSFWWAEWNDDTHSQDGVYISDDGGVTYTKVLNLDGGLYTDLTYQHFDMSLDSLNNLYGLSFTSTYVIKIQQYDDFYFAGGNDGFLIDDLEVKYDCRSFSTFTETACSGSYTSPGGKILTGPGSLIDTIPNAVGCDSTMFITFQYGTSSSSIVTSTCGTPYTAPDGAIYSTSGIYTAVIPNSIGCDSTITIDLSVNNPSASTISPVACVSYTAPDGATYTTSGSYTAVIPNTVGCDSTITVNLTVNYPTSETINPIACDQFVAADGATYNTSGTYTAVIPNSTGCDSTITINLTVNESTSSVEGATGCKSYTWPLNGTTYSTSGFYTHTLTNSVGCDSVVTLALFIQPGPTMTITSSNGTTLHAQGNAVAYNWIDCNTMTSVGSTANLIAPANGQYAVIGTDADGCSDTSACFTVVGVGIADFNPSNVSIYPNPAQDNLFIQTEYRVLNSDIYDAAGKLIKSTPNKQINVNDLPAGMYQINVRFENGGVVRQKFIKL